MGKKIKFPLELVNGVQVRTIEQLRDNFDFEKILGYFVEGKLQIWLQDRYYENEAKQIKELNKNENFNILKTKICEILGVEYQSSDEFDIDEIEKRNKRINMLRQYTDNKDIIEKINNVVFDQEELAHILDMNIDTVYLCKGQYTIPLSKMNMTYIGIGNPVITVNSKEDIDFDSNYIILENVTIRSENIITIKAKNSNELKYDGNLKLKDDKNWIVYLKKRRFYDETITWCKVDKNGERYQEADNLYKSRPDGSCEELLVKENNDISSFCIFENTVFYRLKRGFDVSIHKIDINGNNKEDLNIEFRDILSSFGEKGQTLFCNKKWIVYIADSSIYKVKHNGECKQRIVSPFYGTDIKINNDYLFYIDSNSKFDYLYRFDLESNSTITIDSNVKKIETSREKLYYVKREKTGWGEYRNNPQWCFYETNLDGKDRRLLEHFYPFDTITRLEYKEGILYYYKMRQTGSSCPEIGNKIILSNC